MSSIFKLIIFSVGFLSLVAATDIYAKEPTSTLFESDFETKNVSQLNIISGNWSIDADDALTGFEEEASKSGNFEFGDKTWDNFTLMTDIQPELGKDFSIKFRKTAESYYQLKLHTNPLEDPLDFTPKISLLRNTNGVIQLLDEENNFEILNDELYHIEIKAEGKKIKISFDEKDIFYVYDLESTIKKGLISYEFDTQDYGFSIFKIKNIKVVENLPYRK